MQTIYELPVRSSSLDVYSPQLQVSLEPEFDVQDWELNRIQRNSLKALTVFHDATADLLLRYLKLRPSSIGYLQTNLNALCPKDEDERYIEISAGPKQDEESRFGSGQFVYRLGRRGYALMKDQGHVTRRYRKPEESLKKTFPMRHRLAVNEFLYKALQVSEQVPGVTLLEKWHEKDWNANPLRLPVLTDAGYKPRHRWRYIYLYPRWQENRARL